FIIGQYEFYEAPNQRGTGILKGKLRINFYLDENDQIKYNGLKFFADGFSNNQFEGTWTSYTSGKSKKCNWGDYRIPDSQKLDTGVGEFSPAEKYATYGWSNYRKAWGYTSDKREVEKAKLLEKEK
ncbi:MAG: hypothetical protein AAF696_29895, partial [Bacteroidota bacterium]